MVDGSSQTAGRKRQVGSRSGASRAGKHSALERGRTSLFDMVMACGQGLKKRCGWVVVEEEREAAAPSFAP